VNVDAARWARHIDALQPVLERAAPERRQDVRERFLRAAALESTVLADLVRPSADATTFVLRSSLNDDEWTSLVEATQLVVECHRRALVVASDAAESQRPLDADLIARLQDLIVESQDTYTVSDEHGDKLEVELPKRQYKPVSNYLLATDGGLVVFAPAADVASEVDRLVRELASPAFARLHPVVQASFLHVALVRIHPFADGNGRLARTVASIPLLRVVGLPQLVLADQWPTYSETLDRTNRDDVEPFVDLVLASQINAVDLARSVLETDLTEPPQVARVPVSDSPERVLLDVVQVHARDRLGPPSDGWEYSVVRPQPGTVVVALARGAERRQIEFTAVAAAADDRWLSVVASSGDTLELWRRDVFPAPTEIVHLRVQAWLDRVLRHPGHELAGAHRGTTRAHPLFVLGVPRSGTTMMGSFIGSHPDVVDLAEYGGFYVTHSVVAAYVDRLPGNEHDGLLESLRSSALEHAVTVAADRGCAWFCDATPWNLEIAGALAASLPDAVFVLMVRHFAGSVLSLRPFQWAGNSWSAAARLWVTLNDRTPQLPDERTIVVGYDVFAAHPAESVAGLKDALSSLGLDPDQFDAGRLAASHAHIVGHPRPTVGNRRDDGEIVLDAIPSVDLERWTPEIHAEVWPLVADVHRALLDRYPSVYVPPERPDHVARDEW
jgi:hypothetical protein